MEFLVKKGQLVYQKLLSVKLGDLVICGNANDLCWIGIFLGSSGVLWFLELARPTRIRAPFEPYTQKYNFRLTRLRLLAEPEIKSLLSLKRSEKA